MLRLCLTMGVTAIRRDCPRGPAGSLHFSRRAVLTRGLRSAAPSTPAHTGTLSAAATPVVGTHASANTPQSRAQDGEGQPQREQQERLQPQRQLRQRPAATQRWKVAVPAEGVQLPVVHPSATTLPPLTQSASTRPKFSFRSDPSQRRERDYFSVGASVPNDKPKPLLPMWASSLTSPALGRQRLVEENWISTDAMGTVPTTDTAAFESWVMDLMPTDSLLAAQLRENVELHLRRSFQRGLYARRDFVKGEEIMRIPLVGVDAFEKATGERSTERWGMALNVDTLRRHSVAVQCRGVPSYATVKSVLDETRSSSFDPTPHPLFVDQVCLALMLACERAAGAASPLHPYLRLLDGGNVEGGGLDDEHIRELHLGVLDPVTHMEYNDHRNRFTHYLRELHRAWWDSFENARRQHQGLNVVVESATSVGKGEMGKAASRGGLGACGKQPSPLLAVPLSSSPATAAAVEGSATGASAVHAGEVRSLTAAGQGGQREKGFGGPSVQPPPSLQDLSWAFRIVLSRHHMLPGLRGSSTATLCKESTDGGNEADNGSLDAFGRAVMRGKWAFYDKVLGAVDEDRLHANAYDPLTIATVVPLLDMFQHPPSGIANVLYTVENLPLTEGQNSMEGCKISDVDDPRVPHIVVRTTEDVEAMDELTLLFPRCYSVSYSLYRFGFLPLRNREDDMVERMQESGVDGEYCRTGSSFTQQSFAARLLSMPSWSARYLRKVIAEASRAGTGSSSSQTTQ